MRMVLTYNGGRTVEGILLAASREHMRLVFAGSGDTVELLRIHGNWRAENGETVEIEAVSAIDGVDNSAVLASFAPRAMSAGTLAY